MNNILPFISVITIVKNNAKFISRAIDSVLSQTLTNYEYIIVNDGSTDRTQELIDRYCKSDNRIKSVHLKENVGRSMARNIGLDTAKGRYLFFIDSDDYMPSNALEKLYDIALRHCADIVYAGIKCYDIISGELKPDHYTEKIINRERHNIRLEDHLDLVDNHLIVGRLYNREFLISNNISFSKKRKNGEDVLFAFYTAYYANRISLVPNLIAYNYSIGNYINTANESKLFDARENLSECIDFANRNDNKKLRKKMIIKGALFSSKLERAEKVYNYNPDKIREYISTLLPLVKNCTIDLLLMLPEYERKFVSVLLAGDYYKAYNIWKDKKKLYKPKNPNEIKKEKELMISALRRLGIEGQEQTFIINRLESLKKENKKLTYKLDELYRSSCWRITAPLRKGIKKIRGY